VKIWFLKVCFFEFNLYRYAAVRAPERRGEARHRFCVSERRRARVRGAARGGAVRVKFSLSIAV
jgi:hypothetical protein